MTGDPDSELVQQAGEGDRSAAEILVARHLPKMLSLARRMLGNAAEAEDAVQESFLKFWKHAARWQPGQARFETWLYRVTLNACYDRLRRKKTVPLAAAMETADSDPGPFERISDQAVASAVRAAVELLPERQRAAILLCHIEGLGNIEAAEILDISVEALESLLSRGRRALKQRLQHLKDGP